MMSVRLSGAGNGPKSLLATFIFQVPLKFGFVCAIIEVANAVTDKAATMALRIVHFPFKEAGDADRRCSLAYHFQTMPVMRDKCVGQALSPANPAGKNGVTIGPRPKSPVANARGSK
jgi:hypothetical protein